MKKTLSIVLVILLVVSSFAAKTAATAQPILQYLSPFVIEKTEYEASGVINEVVFSVSGRGYATVSVWRWKRGKDTTCLEPVF